MLLLLLLGPISCGRRSPAERAYVDDLGRQRQAKDAHLRSSSGPLTPEQRAHFAGLGYFAADLDLVFEAWLQPAATPDTTTFVTSTGTRERYLRLGVLRFSHHGRACTLTMFQSLEGGWLFLPFADATSGRETYGAGRYVDPEPLDGDRYRIDFNRAYNPYCAYNSNWVCPMPPVENRLPLRILAGEKSFSHAP